jgi:hypothetical protein
LTFTPTVQYLRNLKISKLHKAPLFIWKLQVGVCMRESIKSTREEFIKMMYVA